jgi:thiol:disulfide interchange protein DsbC
MKKSSIFTNLLLSTISFLLVATSVSPAAYAEPLDLSAAVKIGSGKKTIIEFTDPDCPFCRKAAAYFHNRQGVTRYVFFKPLARHPEAKDKARFILSSANQAKAYEDVMGGKYDKVKPGAGTAKGGRLLERHLAMATELNIKSTPTFMIFGRIIEGFNQQKIDELLR